MRAGMMAAANLKPAEGKPFESGPNSSHTGDPSTEQIRVSVREIRETVWRALFSAGVSHGEATLAATAVTFGETHFGCGLDAVLPELDRLPPGNVPCSITPGSVDIIDDPARRGPLLLAPLGIGLVAARAISSPLFLPAIGWHPALVAMLSKQSAEDRLSLAAVELSAGSSHGRGVLVEPDGSVTTLDLAVVEPWLAAQVSIVDLVGGERAGGGGVLISSSSTRLGVPPTSVPSYPAATMNDRRRRCLQQGVLVPTSLWEPIYEISRRFLVPEA